MNYVLSFADRCFYRQNSIGSIGIQHLMEGIYMTTKTSGAISRLVPVPLL